MKILLALYVLLMGSISYKAQHCKFDAQNVIVIKLVNSKGKPRAKEGFNFFINTENLSSNDSTSKCKAAFKIYFDTCSKVLLHTDDAIWNSYAATYKNLKLFKLKECYAIIISDAVLNCILNKNKSINIKCRFKKNETISTYTITKENIYPLCSSFGKWEDIKPVEIVLTN